MLSMAITTLMASAQEQQLDLMEVVPNDSTVRVGILDCGAKYYIRRNTKDPKRANFHIAYNVGAIQEQDNQNGLAHFLEHMAFNGSKHFPKGALINYLQSIGVRFGENLNAGTSVEVTTYMITNVPLLREGIIDTALLTLHDWAGFISLNEKDIDDERKVITEEWRMGNNAERRVIEKQYPVLFNNSLYSRRNVIGTPEVLANFKYDELRDFYHKWYRPDLASFMIVGDIDVDAMEARLKRVMSDVKPSAEKAPIEVIKVADVDSMVVSTVSDPELTQLSLEFIYRHKPLADKYNNRLLAIKNGMIYSFIGNMLNNRFAEISQKEDAPFTSAGGGYMTFMRPFDIFDVSVSPKEGQIEKAIEVAYTELLRMQRGGFVTSEFDRAKAAILRGAESAYENRNDRRNGSFVNQYMANFQKNIPYPSAETSLSVNRKVIESITLAEVNSVAASLIRDKNSIAMILSPEKEGLKNLTDREVIAAIERVKASDIELYVDDVISEPLISEELPGCKILSTQPGKFESTEIVLENGVKVILKKTDFKADEIMLKAFQKGGTSKIKDLGELYSISLYPQFENMAGVGKFSAIQLGKMLNGKIASLSPSVTEFTQGFKGSCSPKDFETMMQLTYLYFVQPRFEQADFNTFMNQIKDVLPNLSSNPNYVLADSLTKTLYANNPRSEILSQTLVDQVSMEKMEKAYRSFFSNANDMTFMLVGNIDVDSIKPLIVKYLGSLPSSKVAQEWGTEEAHIVKGEVENRFKTKQQTPKATVMSIYSGDRKATVKENLQMDMLRYILEVRYLKTIREESGGTYSVGVSMDLKSAPAPEFTMVVSFTTEGAKVDALLPLVQKELDEIAANGPSEENLKLTKEFFIKKLAENATVNGFWMNNLYAWSYRGQDTYDGYEQLLNEVTVKDIKNTAKEMFSQGNRVIVVQMPE